MRRMAHAVRRLAVAAVASGLAVSLFACAAERPAPTSPRAPAGDRSGSLACAPGAPQAEITVDRSCKADADCAVGAHIRDCCGSIALIGIRASERSRFDAAERACNPQGGACECVAKPTVMEDGRGVRELRDAWVSCLAGRCTALAP